MSFAGQSLIPRAIFASDGGSTRASSLSFAEEGAERWDRGGEADRVVLHDDPYL